MQIAALLHRGLPRVAYSEGTSVNLIDNDQDLSVVTINTGGAPGGKGFVKIDGSLLAFNPGPTGCPCEVKFHIFQDGIGTVSRSSYVTVLNEVGLVDDNASGSVTFVIAVPTATTVRFRLKARKNSGTPQRLVGSGELSALYVPFGGTGGSVFEAQSVEPQGVSEAQELKAGENKSN
jgi:hypothetical protein